MADLFTEPQVATLTLDELQQAVDQRVEFQKRSVSPIINGSMLGKFTVGSSAAGSTARIELDGDNARIVINDGTNDRVLIGYHAGGF